MNDPQISIRLGPVTHVRERSLPDSAGSLIVRIGPLMITLAGADGYVLKAGS